MKEIFTVSLSLFVLSVSVVFSQQLQLTEAEKNWLLEHPVIRVGVGTNYAPIQYVTEENGEYKFEGIASDYLSLISKEIGAAFEIEYGITFNEALEMAAEGKLDMFPCIAYSPERDEYLEFTEGYLENPLVIFSNEDAPFINSLKDIESLRIAEVEALYLYNLLKTDLPDAEFIFADNAEAGLEHVAFGRADVNVAGLISGSYLIRKNNWTNIKVAAPTPYPNTVFRMAVREDWPELRSILDKVLAGIDNEQRNQMNQNWIAVRYEHGISREHLIRRTAQVVSVALLIILIILIWNHRLHSEIRRRKKIEESLTSKETELQKMLQEKEVLIQEIYHRVKNNLTLVAGLVSLQASELGSEIAREKMEMVSQRIHSLIILHEKLSYSNDFRRINFSDYLEELIADIRQSFQEKAAQIEIRYQCAEAEFNEKTVIPLGLIVTELLTNAVKYGFDKNSPGEIEIKLEENESGYVLTVANNGKAFPEEVELETSGTLGLMLVSSLSAQLNGSIELIKAPHPVFRICFKV